MPKQSYVSWLHELTPDQLDWIGRKAGRLSEMINAGIPIPQGFILFPQAFYTFLSQNNLKSKIQSQISSVDPYNPTDLEMAARHIQSVIMKKENIWESYRKDMKDPKFRAAIREFVRRTSQ